MELRIAWGRHVTRQNSSHVSKCAGTILAASNSTKNAAGRRDPEMTSTRKGNLWHFGMKAHIGVDAKSGLVHSVRTTTASVQDVNVFTELLHGEEED